MFQRIRWAFKLFHQIFLVSVCPCIGLKILLSFVNSEADGFWVLPLHVILHKYDIAFYLLILYTRALDQVAMVALKYGWALSRHFSFTLAVGRRSVSCHLHCRPVPCLRLYLPPLPLTFHWRLKSRVRGSIRAWSSVNYLKSCIGLAQACDFKILCLRVEADDAVQRTEGKALENLDVSTGHPQIGGTSAFSVVFRYRLWNSLKALALNSSLSGFARQLVVTVRALVHTRVIGVGLPTRRAEWPLVTGFFPESCSLLWTVCLLSVIY